MRVLKILFVALCLTVTCLVSSPPALARGWHGSGHHFGGGHFGHHFGGGRWFGGFGFYGGPRFGWSGWPYAGFGYPGPNFYPGYYDYPGFGPAYYPRFYYSQPPTYIERNAGNDWYYCRSASKYYPYVKTCAEAWQRVSPQPAPSSTTTTPYYRDP